MKFHKEGYGIIVCFFLVLVFFNVVVYYLGGRYLPFVFYFFILVSLIFFSMMLNFFRTPKRLFNEDTENKVIAPADGKIVAIEEVTENEYFKGKRIQLSIFMNIFDAHVNWVPVEGTIVHSSHQNGRFIAAYLPKSSTENERSTVVIQRDNGEQILVRQIAGAVAKRIVTYAHPPHKCRINEQLGFIKFGSRVDLFLPLDAEIKVQLDEKVKGNQTIIAQLNAKN
jgi:phosphatidylserine decarboxylase